MFTAYISKTATNEVTFTNLSSDLNASFIWQFADGSPSEFGVNATHTYAAPGSYPVNLNMTGNGCYDDYTFFVTINPDTIVGFYLGGVVSVGSNVIDMGSVKLYSLDTLSSSVELIGQYPMNNLGSYITTIMCLPILEVNIIGSMLSRSI
jgi:PKD repeat protein